VIQGWRITDESTLAEITADKRILGHETVIRLPARMAPVLMEVCDGDGTTGIRSVSRG
jgi:hypothetical protein